MKVWQLAFWSEYVKLQGLRRRKFGSRGVSFLGFVMRQQVAAAARETDVEVLHVYRNPLLQDTAAAALLKQVPSCFVHCFICC